MKPKPVNKSAYLENPGRCPYCKSEAVISSDLDFRRTEPGVGYIPHECGKCGKTWEEIYRLVDINAD